jgi:hypothetical protein
VHGAFDQRYGGEGAAELVDLQFPGEISSCSAIELGMWTWSVGLGS